MLLLAAVQMSQYWPCGGVGRGQTAGTGWDLSRPPVALPHHSAHPAHSSPSLLCPRLWAHPLEGTETVERQRDAVLGVCGGIKVDLSEEVAPGRGAVCTKAPLSQ